MSADIEISIGEITERPADPTSSPQTCLQLQWEAAKRPHLFPLMRAELAIYRLTAIETQLDFSGCYEPPLGVLGSAMDSIVGYRVAQVSVHRFVTDVPVFQSITIRPASARSPPSSRKVTVSPARRRRSTSSSTRRSPRSTETAELRERRPTSASAGPRRLEGLGGDVSKRRGAARHTPDAAVAVLATGSPTLPGEQESQVAKSRMSGQCSIQPPCGTAPGDAARGDESRSRGHGPCWKPEGRAMTESSP